MGSSAEQPRPGDATDPVAVRDPLAVPEAVIDARRRPMSERLELALNWNTVASELRAGLAAVKRGAPADVLLGDVKVPIAHRDDLLRMKRASGRPQDLEDVRLLESLDDE